MKRLPALAFALELLSAAPALAHGGSDRDLDNDGSWDYAEDEEGG